MTGWGAIECLLEWASLLSWESGSLLVTLRGFWARLQRGPISFGGVLDYGLCFRGLGARPRTCGFRAGLNRREGRRDAGRKNLLQVGLHFSSGLPRWKHLLWMVMSAQLKQLKQSAAEKSSMVKFSCTQGSKSEYLSLPKSGQYCSGSLLVGWVHISLQTEMIKPTGTKAGRRGRDRGSGSGEATGHRIMKKAGCTLQEEEQGRATGP